MQYDITDIKIPSKEDYLKRKIIELFDREDWVTVLDDTLKDLAKDSQTKIELIWIVKDMVKEGKIEQALKVAEYYSNDFDPDLTNEVNLKTDNNEEVRWITSVRGCVPHLLASIIATLDTRYYTQVLDILEKLSLKKTEKGSYVRLQALAVLNSFFVNYYAIKDINDPKSSFLTEDQKARLMAVMFQALRENKTLYRLLEVIAGNFNRLTRLNEDDAKDVVVNLIFTNVDKKEFLPEYVLDVIAPTLIYFAEIRSGAKDSFNDTFFKDLLIEVLKRNSGFFKSTIIWHIWKNIEEHNQNLDKFKDYFKYFTEGDFNKAVLTQLEFLIEHVLPLDLNSGIKLLENTLAFIKKQGDGVESKDVWLLTMDNIIKVVAKDAPKKYNLVLDLLFDIWSKGNIYIGDIPTILTAYKNAPVELQEGMSRHSKDVYIKMQSIKPNLKDVEILW